MKMTLGFLILLFSSISQSKEVKITKFLASEVDEVSASFDYNPEINRAWVKAITKKYITEDIEENTYRLNLKGLSFNNDKKEVTYVDQDGIDTVCVAAVSNKHNSAKFKMKETQKCTFATKKVTRDIDDGFIINKVDFLELYLVIP